MKHYNRLEVAHDTNEVVYIMATIALRSISQSSTHLFLRVDAIETSYKELVRWADENDVIIDDIELDYKCDEFVLSIALGGKTGL